MNNILVTLCVLMAIVHANAVETDDESNLEVLFVKKVDTSTKTQFLIPSDTDEDTKNSLLKAAVSGSACGCESSCGQDKCCCESNDDKPNPTEEEEEEETPSTDEETPKDCTNCTILRVNVTLPLGTPVTEEQKDMIGNAVSGVIEQKLKLIPKNTPVDNIVDTLNSTLSGIPELSLDELGIDELPLVGDTGLTDLLKGLDITIKIVTECVKNPDEQDLLTITYPSDESIIADVNLCGLK